MSIRGNGSRYFFQMERDAGLEAVIGLTEIMEERQHCESIQRDILNQGLTSGIGKAGASDRSSHKPPKYTGDIGTMVGKW